MISNIRNNQISPYSTPQHKKQSVSFGARADMTTKFLKSALLGTICETAANNPVLCQSAFSLGINVGARPATNYIVTPDKTDAGMASAHSIASGVVGFLWPLVVVTPLVAAVNVLKKKPQTILNAEIIKKFYPTVGIEEAIENGKPIKRVMTNTKGELIRKNGTPICRELEPIKLKDGDISGRIEKLEKEIQKTKSDKKKQRLLEEKADLEVRKQAFEKEMQEFNDSHEDLKIDPKSGVARSTKVFKTKNGILQLDDKGEKIGCVVQKDGTPITEELERGLNKENNMIKILQWIPDILFAVPRSMLTVACIPWILKNVFGMEKKPKNAAVQQQAVKPIQIDNQKGNNASTRLASAFKKGGI